MGRGSRAVGFTLTRRNAERPGWGEPRLTRIPTLPIGLSACHSLPTDVCAECTA